MCGIFGEVVRGRWKARSDGSGSPLEVVCAPCQSDVVLVALACASARSLYPVVYDLSFFGVWFAFVTVRRISHDILHVHTGQHVHMVLRRILHSTCGKCGIIAILCAVTCSPFEIGW